ncbi:hypothetical protein OHB01_16835 [Microbispora hainanensis]|uniref:Uncharacterized protein n=1 Tax=Microbispora hainanensis TaxID=568844 RepID=A0ABZ1SIG6_9ACTN|nr:MULTISPECIES: hypothetical protein [Microbispora]
MWSTENITVSMPYAVWRVCYRDGLWHATGGIYCASYERALIRYQE